MSALSQIINSKFLIVSLVIILNISSQIIYKSIAVSKVQKYDLNFIIDMFLNWKVISAMFMQIISLALWFGILKKYELIWSGLMISVIPVGIIFAGYFFFGETLSSKILFGSLLIVAGLFLVNSG